MVILGETNDISDNTSKREEVFYTTKYFEQQGKNYLLKRINVPWQVKSKLDLHNGDQMDWVFIDNDSVLLRKTRTPKPPRRRIQVPDSIPVIDQKGIENESGGEWVVEQRNKEIHTGCL